MTTLTYTQAVANYQALGKKLEKQHQNLKSDIVAFIKEAKKYIQATSQKKDQGKLASLESQMK
jgi:hypothetical protein